MFSPLWAGQIDFAFHFKSFGVHFPSSLTRDFHTNMIITRRNKTSGIINKRATLIHESQFSDRSTFASKTRCTSKTAKHPITLKNNYFTKEVSLSLFIHKRASRICKSCSAAEGSEDPTGKSSLRPQPRRVGGATARMTEVLAENFGIHGMGRFGNLIRPVSSRHVTLSR